MSEELDLSEEKLKNTIQNLVNIYWDPGVVIYRYPDGTAVGQTFTQGMGQFRDFFKINYSSQGFFWEHPAKNTKMKEAVYNKKDKCSVFFRSSGIKHR